MNKPWNLLCVNKYFRLINLTVAISLCLLGASTFVAANEIDIGVSTIIIPRQADESWLQEHDGDDMTVYSRAVDGSAIREVMAESIIEAPPWKVLAALVDYPAYPSFMPYVKKNEIQKIQGNKTWIFQQLGFPWPISDRYYTIILSSRADPQHKDSYEISWDISNELSVKQGDGMQVMLNQGGWRLISAEHGKATRILYYLYTDPGGALPGWVSNMANTVAVPKVINALKNWVKTTSYPQPDS